MSHASFDPSSFLMRINPGLLSELAAHHKLEVDFSGMKDIEKVADHFMTSLKAADSSIQGPLWLAIYDIDDMATRNGCELLLNQVNAKHKSKLNEAFYNKLKNLKEKSMYFYLHFNELFRSCYADHELANMRGWKAEVVSKKPFAKIKKNIPALKAALQEIYTKEYKGEHLVVNWFEKEDKVFFIAYIEDVYDATLEFKKGKLSEDEPRKPVFMAHFKYQPEEGILEVRVRGGNKKIKTLQRTFIREMLKEEPNLKDEIRYNFNKIADLKNLELPLRTMDGVERVLVQALRLKHKITKAILYVDLGEEDGSGAETMDTKLKEMNIDLADYKVTQFKLRFFFEKTGSERAKRVSATMSHPNSCDLMERPIDEAVRGLLKRWNLQFF